MGKLLEFLVGCVGVVIVVLILLEGSCHYIGRILGPKPPKAPDIHGTTPAVVTVPYQFSIVAEGSVKMEFASARCRSVEYHPGMRSRECDLRRPGDPEEDLLYIPRLGTFDSIPKGGRAGGPIRVVAIGCTADNWSHSDPDNLRNPCLKEVTDPNKQVRFTITDAR
jgi:hypothetical protein